METKNDPYESKYDRYLACPKCRAPVLTMETNMYQRGWRVGQFLCLGDCEMSEELDGLRPMAGEEVQYEKRETGRRIGDSYQAKRNHQVYGPIWVRSRPEWLFRKSVWDGGDPDLTMVLDIGRAVVSLFEEEENDFWLSIEDAGKRAVNQIRRLLERAKHAQESVQEYERRQAEQIARMLERAKGLEEA